MKLALICAEIASIVLAASQIALYFIDIDSKEYIIPGIGIVVIMIPLIVLGSRLRLLKEAGIIPWVHAIVIALLTASGITFSFLNVGDFLIPGVVVLVACFAWFFAVYSSGWHRGIFASLVTITARASAAFLAVFMPLYIFYIPIHSMEIGIMPAWDGAFDIVAGCAILCLLVFAWLVARYRINVVTAFAILYLWYDMETQWMMRNWDRMLGRYEGTLIFVITVMFLLAANFSFALGRFIGDTMQYAKEGKSGFLGPWFAPILATKRDLARDPAQRKAIKRGIIVVAILAALATPGLLVTSNAIPYTVTIVPRTDYTMRFSFWASSDLSIYSPTVMATLDSHHANLDLGASIPTLIALEATMPNVTYRIVLSPPTFDQLEETVIARAEAMIPYVLNGTLDQWRGFAFDIEGTFAIGPYADVNDAITEWNATFNYVYNNASARVGKLLEMESVGSHVFGVDVPFDGDMDMQLIEGYDTDVPARFTSFAPMIYRCLSSDKTATTEPSSIFSPWATSYSIYDSLYTLANNIRNESRLGVYLGVTNDSCYSRDLLQPEPISWGSPGGFGNLIRDTLIAKHFGIPEVTYFLQFSVQSQGCGCPEFGAFDSYGDEFLDVMNATVNTNPPAQFSIWYNYNDAALATFLYRDILGDVSHPSGVTFVILAAVAATCAVIITEWWARRAHRM